MKILGVDTTSKGCSVAVVDNGHLLSELTKVSSHTHAVHLMGMIRDALTMSGTDVTDLDGFSVTEGPGSFTGLRIGISTIKGLAAAVNKPVVGVSSLRVLASQMMFYPSLICPVLDARKGEVYFSKYRFAKGILEEETSAQVLPPMEAVSGIKEPCIFVGDGAYLYKKEITLRLNGTASFAPPYYNILRASTVANLGLLSFKNGKTNNLGSLAPCYIRNSDAKRKRGDGQLKDG